MWRLLVCIRRGCDSTEKASLRIVRHPHIEKDTLLESFELFITVKEVPTSNRRRFDRNAEHRTGFAMSEFSFAAELDSDEHCIGGSLLPNERRTSYSSSTRSNHAVTAIKRNVDATSTTLRVGPWRPSWWEHQIDSSSHETKHDVRSFHFSKENASQVSILS